MTELNLYKFIKDNAIEWHRQDNSGTEDVIIFPYTFHMDEFSKLVKSMAEDYDGIEFRLRNGYFCVWMRDICDYYGIELNNVFNGKDY